MFRKTTLAWSLASLFAAMPPEAWACTTNYASNTAFAGSEPNGCSVNFTSDVTVTVNTVLDNVTPSVSTSSNNTGRLVIAGFDSMGRYYIPGGIGASDARLKSLSINTTGADSYFSIGGHVYAQTIAISGTGHPVQMNGGLTAETLALDSSGQVEVVGGISLNANVTAAGGSSLLKVGNGASITGTVGAPGAALGVLGLADGASNFTNAAAPVYALTTETGQSNTTTFAGGLSGTTLSLISGADNARFIIGAGKNLAVAVNLALPNLGTLEFQGSTTVANPWGSVSNGLKQVLFDAGMASIGAAIHTANAANSILVKSGATAAYTADTSFSGRLTLESGATLDLGTRSITGASTGNKSDLVTVAGATLSTTLTADANNAAGKMSLEGTHTSIASGTKLFINVPGTASLTNGRQFKIIDNSTGTGVARLNAADITDNSAVLSFSQVAAANNNEDLVVQVSRDTAGYSGASGLAAGQRGYLIGQMLSTLVSSGASNSDMQAFLNTLDTYTPAQLRAALQKLSPAGNGGGSTAAFSFASGSHNNVGNRLAALRGDVSLADAGVQTGLAAGEVAPDRHFWLKMFGTRNRAEQRDGFDGYKAFARGLSVGADRDVLPDLTLGAAFTYATTNVDQQDTRVGDNTRIKSYQLTGYGAQEFGAAYVDTMLSYSKHQNTTQRATALSRVASGQFDADQWSLRLGAGYKLALSETLRLTPMASLEWSTLRQQAYTERNAGALNLQVDGQTTDSLKGGLGGRLSGEWSWMGTLVKPEMHAMAFHEYGDRRTDTTASMTGGGGAFTTTGQSLPRDSYNVGGGLSVQTGQASQFTLSYDYEGRQGYSSHSAQVVGRWAF